MAASALRQLCVSFASGSRVGIIIIISKSSSGVGFYARADAPDAHPCLMCAHTPARTSCAHMHG